MALLPVTPPNLFQPGLEVGVTRVIEDKGIYVLTDAELNAWRLRVLVDVIVEPEVVYKSYRPNEPENFFGYFELVEGGFVIEKQALKYLHQQIFRYQNDAAKSLFDVKVNAISGSIGTFNAAVAILNSIPASSGLAYVEWAPGEHLQCPVTDLWFKTVPGCRIAVHTEYLPLPKIGGVPASTRSPESLPSPSSPDPEKPGSNPSPPSDAPATRPPDQPYDPSTQDGNRTTPTGNPLPQTGQWFVVYSGFNSGCQGEYSGHRYAIPGATNRTTAPTEGSHSPGTCGGQSYNADVLYDGGILYRAFDVTSQTFEFVP